MKKVLYLITGIAAFMMTACNTNTPETPISESYPKKHLMEEFVSQECGNCPYGMDFVHAFVENDSNWIVVVHHDGYKTDNFTVSGSTTITKALSVNGTPSVTINRAKTKYINDNGNAKSGTVIHPGYLETADKSQFDQTTYASVRIRNTYDADTRELTIHVSGEVAKENAPALYLTVLVKESGMVDYQHDYYETYEGWEEYRHTNAVRAFLTAAKGDAVSLTKHRYSADYTLTLEDQWVPENCMVVAFLSENFKPVIQAEQAPVVTDTQGGANILHGGITPVPVTDYYPEPGVSVGPRNFTNKDTIAITTMQAGYTAYPTYGFNYWTLLGYSADATIKVNLTNTVPICYFYLFTETDQTTIPNGTYEINLSMQPGTVLAGYRDDEHHDLGGSSFYLADKSYFNQGYLVPQAQWLIADGTFIVTDEGWTLVGHTRNGADICLSGSTITTSSKAPAKQTTSNDIYGQMNGKDCRERKCMRP